jgi:fatty aldehyde-generating acyl-ACP reductase
MNGYAAKASTCVTELLPQADIIIAIASSGIENFDALLCKPGVLICDAGYPKNLVYIFDDSDSKHLFCGGMGQVQGGFTFSPSIHRELYDFPLKNIAHGCLLEAIILALEKRFIPYSTGKGNITVEKMEWIYNAAKKHGITEAPFFNPLLV